MAVPWLRTLTLVSCVTNPTAQLGDGPIASRKRRARLPTYIIAVSKLQQNVARAWRVSNRRRRRRRRCSRWAPQVQCNRLSQKTWREQGTEVHEGGIGNEQALCGSVRISRQDTLYENLGCWVRPASSLRTCLMSESTSSATDSLAFQPRKLHEPNSQRIMQPRDSSGILRDDGLRVSARLRVRVPAAYGTLKLFLRYRSIPPARGCDPLRIHIHTHTHTRARASTHTMHTARKEGRIGDGWGGRHTLT